ncbi:helix-turn-helix domain-containing protein [Actinokineospora sp.]|uniref:helix-turn-helix domain-containing protein n=1 Tax=Actinokineospora sp. TaxID=1872133 RepID=UPI0040378B3F
MDSAPQQIGQRVRYWRERRNLTRQRFADMVSRSTSWLDKIESGERELARLPMIERVAAALGLDPVVLTDANYAQRAEQCVDASEVQAIRAALAAYPGLAVDDTWSLARATRSVARAMTSTHQQSQAAHTLLAMADRMRAETETNATELLSLYGMLYLAGSITAAGQEDSVLAREMHDEAMLAAHKFEPHYNTHHTFFGMINTLIHRVSALVRLHESGRALAFAATIDPVAVMSLSAERQSNFLLDLTEAHANVGNYRQAVALLGQAEQIAPEEVRCRPLAHGLLRSLLHNTSGEPAKLVKQMARRAGVEA